MTRFLLGLLLMYGAAEWIEQDYFVNALLCVGLGAVLMFWGAYAVRAVIDDDQEYGP